MPKSCKFPRKRELWQKLSLMSMPRSLSKLSIITMTKAKERTIRSKILLTCLLVPDTATTKRSRVSTKI